MTLESARRGNETEVSNERSWRLVARQPCMTLLKKSIGFKTKAVTDLVGNVFGF